MPTIRKIKVNGVTYDLPTGGGSGAVNSVNGKTGDVVLTASDVGAITNTVNNLTNYYLKDETYTKAQVNNLISSFATFEVVQTLPTTNIKTNVIYLVPKSTAQTNNTYDEYINTTGTSAGWEKIGDTEIDLSNYYTKSQTDTLLNAKASDTPTFTEASTRTNISSGESTSTLFGKIKKWFTDLKAVAFSGKTSDLTNDSNFVSDANYVHTDNNYTSTEKTKLNGIESGAEVNQNAFSELQVYGDTIHYDTPTVDILATSKTSPIKLKPGVGIDMKADTGNPDRLMISCDVKSFAHIQVKPDSSPVIPPIDADTAEDTLYIKGEGAVTLTRDAQNLKMFKISVPVQQVVSTTDDGLCPQLPNEPLPVTNQKYLRQDGTWAVPASQGGGGVAGVKGDSESTYRTGNVNLTSDNIGAISSSNPIIDKHNLQIKDEHTGATSGKYGIDISHKRTDLNPDYHSGTDIFRESVKVSSTEIFFKRETMVGQGISQSYGSIIYGTDRKIKLDNPLEGQSGSIITDNDLATTSVNGLMSSTDKTKLDGISSGAEVNQNAYDEIEIFCNNIYYHSYARNKGDVLHIIAGKNISVSMDSNNHFTFNVEPDVLWTNSSPTSNFAGQTITLSQSISNYTYYEVIYKFSASVSNDRMKSTGRIPVNCGAWMDISHYYNYYRSVDIPSGTSMVFSNGVRYNTYGNSATNNQNGYAIPYKVLGWK